MIFDRALVIALVFGIFNASSVQAQPGGGGSDTLKYRTKEGTDEQKIGEAKESIAGITISAGGKSVVTVLPNQVISLNYGKLAGVDDKVRLEIPSWDAKGAAEARKMYTDLLKTASAAGADDRTKRFLEYKVAMASARVADAKAGDEFKTEAAAAIEKLQSVARASAKSWEVWPASRTVARLQVELGKFNDAAATWATLAKVEGLPAELKGEAYLAEVDVLFRSGSALAAATAVENLAKVAGLNPSQKTRLEIFQAALKGAQDKTDAAKVQAAATVVRGLFDKLPEPSTKAAAHLTLGELYAMANLPRDAMWEFLWVEAVYNQDKDELMKALDRLADTFDKLGDKDRAAVYREKVLKARSG